jgi:hypothetical protein
MPRENRNLITWGDIDVRLIEQAYEYVAKKISGKFCDSNTMSEIVILFESQLPEDYWVKCDLELNTPEIIDGQHVLARVFKNTLPIGTNNYIDVIF